MEDAQHIVQFILYYVEVNAILLPGRIPGYKRIDDIQLLPSSTTRQSVWLVYQEVTMELSLKTAVESTSHKIWRQLLPRIIIAHPMRGLYWTCQQNSIAIIYSANLSEEEKSEVRATLCILSLLYVHQLSTYHCRLFKQWRHISFVQP